MKIQSDETIHEPSTPSFEDAMRELENIVSKLEDGQTSLDESISLVRRGQELAARCEQTLNEAELTLSTLVATDEGELVEEELDRDGEDS
jgi:exodeoxyribonuclease VII small subunit